MLAKDIMRRKIVAVESRMTVQELTQVLQINGITGAPVVDGVGAVLGVVSQTDLVRARRGRPAGEIPPFHRELDGEGPPLGIHFEEADLTLVEEIMTPGAISFDEQTRVETLAAAMLERHIHRVLVTRGEKLVGIVTTMDLLRALVAQRRKRVPADAHAGGRSGHRRR